MTKEQEALKLALEALELHGKQYPHMVKGYCLDAITAIKEALAQPEQDGKCKLCVDGCIACDARAQPEQEAIYGMNPDDWKDLTDAVKKVRDGRGMPLACKPADVFQDWFLWLGTAKIKERT